MKISTVIKKGGGREKISNKFKMLNEGGKI